jgi:hypothetical protein
MRFCVENEDAGLERIGAGTDAGTKLGAS